MSKSITFYAFGKRPVLVMKCRKYPFASYPGCNTMLDRKVDAGQPTIRNRVCWFYVSQERNVGPSWHAAVVLTGSRASLQQSLTGVLHTDN